MGVKYNYMACREPGLITVDMLNRMTANLCRIGIDSITPDNINAVIKRTNLANECNLQLVGFTIEPVTYEEISRMLWFKTNADPITPQKWFSMMREHFPYVMDFNKLLTKAQAKGWSMSETDKAWILASSDEETNVYVYPKDQYLTEKNVWQDAMQRGKV